MGFLEIAVILVVMLVIVIVVLSLTVGKGNRVSEPSCGACGYPTRGISELRCPECGADLKKVGIVMPGDGSSALAGCLMPMLATILIFVFSVGGLFLANMVMPSQEDQSTHFDLSPDSNAYSQVLIRTEMTVIIPASERHQGRSFNASTQYGPPNVATIDFGGGPKTRVELESIKLEVMSMPMPNAPNTITYAPVFRVDPATAIATWSDASGKTQTSSGPVTDKDLLAYFKEYNVDTSKPGVIAEAQQLTAMIDGLIAGQKQFTLQGFTDGGYGSGSSGSIGPKWFILVYFLAWLVIWILTISVLIRRSSRRSKSTSD